MHCVMRAGRSGNRLPVGARFSAPVQTGLGAHPASCTMGTGSFPGVKNGRGVTLIPHPLLVPWSRKSRAIPLLPLWVVRPVQSLSACTRVRFTLFTMSLLVKNLNYRYSHIDQLQTLGSEDSITKYELLTLWRRNYYFFLILAHPVYKM